MNKEEFIKHINNLGISVSDAQLKQLSDYYYLLVTWNKKINLTTIIQEEEVYLKHFYDSLTTVKIVKLNNQKICDIGTGAGFPGIVLKIMIPTLTITLVESLTKRCKFLNEVIKELELTNIGVVNERAEIYGKKNREKFDIVISRAVAKTNCLLEYSVPILKINGIVLTMKGQKEELNEEIYSKLNIQLTNCIEFFLPKENSKRTLTIYKKLNKTNLIYPRNYSIIKKNPL